MKDYFEGFLIAFALKMVVFLYHFPLLPQPP